MAATTSKSKIESSCRVYRRIATATWINGAAEIAPTTTARRALAQYGNGSWAKDRQIFVQGMLQAALRSEELKVEKTVLYHAT
jgi:hypothetical protein